MPAGVALWRLLQISDQLFPTGAYAFSHALETYVDRGMVHDHATCQPLFEALCDHALGPCDAVFCRHAFRAAAQDNMARLMELDHLLTASKVTQELRLESEHTGQAFLRASLAMQPPPLVKTFGVLPGKKPHQATMPLPLASWLRDWGCPRRARYRVISTMSWPVGFPWPCAWYRWARWTASASCSI